MQVAINCLLCARPDTVGAAQLCLSGKLNVLAGLGFPEGTAMRPCTHLGCEKLCMAQRRSLRTGQGWGVWAHNERLGWSVNV